MSVMKNVSWLAMAAAGLLAGASTASAGETVKAKVPFAFVVNGVELPAGEYVVSRDTNQPDLIEIATASGERRALTLSRATDAQGESAEQPKLEFERVGRQVYLTQVTLGPGNAREIAVAAAAGEPQPKR